MVMEDKYQTHFRLDFYNITNFHFGIWLVKRRKSLLKTVQLRIHLPNHFSWIQMRENLKLYILRFYTILTYHNIDDIIFEALDLIIFIIIVYYSDIVIFILLFKLYIIIYFHFSDCYIFTNTGAS